MLGIHNQEHLNGEEQQSLLSEERHVRDSLADISWGELTPLVVGKERPSEAFTFVSVLVIGNKQRKKTQLIKPVSQPRRRNHLRYVKCNS